MAGISRTGIGSLVQVKAAGPQDDVIHSNATTASFQAEIKQHTPFAAMQDVVKPQSPARLGSTLVFKVPKGVHMLNSAYVCITLPTIFDGLSDNQPQDDDQPPAIYKNHLGHLLVKHVALKADGDTIVQYPGEYLYAQYILNTPVSKQLAYKAMMGIREIDYDIDYHTYYSNTVDSDSVLLFEEDDHRVYVDDAKSYSHISHYRIGSTLHIPIPLWGHNEDVAQFFPVGALYDQDVEIHVTLNTFNNLYSTQSFGNYVDVAVRLEVSKHGTVAVVFGDKGAQKVHYEVTEDVVDTGNVTVGTRLVPGDVVSDTALVDSWMYIEHIHLDHNEKQNLVQTPQEYIYTDIKVQKEPLVANQNKISLTFTSPVKQLLWFVSHDSDLRNYNESQFLRFDKARFIFGDEDGAAQMSLMSDDYFMSMQSFNYNRNVPTTNRPLYSYSFSLSPHSGHNTGSIHFGKLPKKILEINGDNLAGKHITIFALCYNILDTQRGAASVRFRA